MTIIVSACGAFSGTDSNGNDPPADAAVGSASDARSPGQDAPSPIITGGDAGADSGATAHAPDATPADATIEPSFTCADPPPTSNAVSIILTGDFTLGSGFSAKAVYQSSATSSFSLGTLLVCAPGVSDQALQVSAIAVNVSYTWTFSGTVDATGTTQFYFYAYDEKGAIVTGNTSQSN